MQVTVYLINPTQIPYPFGHTTLHSLLCTTQCDNPLFQHLNGVQIVEGTLEAVIDSAEDILFNLDLDHIEATEDDSVLEYEVVVSTERLPKSDISFDDVYSAASSKSCGDLILGVECSIEECEELGVTHEDLDKWASVLGEFDDDTELLQNLDKQFDEYLESLSEQGEDTYNALIGYVDTEALKRDLEANYTEVEIDGISYFVV